jgi:hypothetical protein
MSLPIVSIVVYFPSHCHKHIPRKTQHVLLLLFLLLPLLPLLLLLLLILLLLVLLLSAK